jgi:hypothetical protein
MRQLVLKSMIFLTLLSVCVISLAQWVPIVKNIADDTLFYDPSKIIQNGDFFDIRMYTNFKQTRPGDSYGSKSSMMHLSMNCNKKTFYILQMVDFDEEDLQGKSRAKNFQYPKSSPIPDKSSISEIYKQICIN